jgi:hypothetical protein
MPKQHDRPDPRVELWRAFVVERSRLQAERLRAEEADRAALAEIGPTRRPLAPLFEPDQPDPAPATSSPATGTKPQPVRSLEGSRRRPWVGRLLAPALTLAVGLAVGFALASTRVDREPTPSPAIPSTATRSPATQPASAPPTSVVVRRIASPACLETARRGDELIALLNRNRRTEAADLIVAYTVASRQCRKDASR